MVRSEGDLRQARRDAAALKPGALLTHESGTIALVLAKVRRHGSQFYEVMITYSDPEDNRLRGGMQLWRAKNLLEIFEVQHETG